MAGHYAGTINSFADLKATIEAALATEGWAESSGIYNKGGMHVQLSTVGAGAGTGLQVAAGTGQSSGTLNGATPFPVRIHDWGSDPIAWPASYELHVGDAPDEVYAVLRHNVERIQVLAFGKSPAPGNPTGYWINGSAGPSHNFSNPDYRWPGSATGLQRNIAPDTRSGNNNGAMAAGVLASYGAAAGYQPYYYHDGDRWGPVSASHTGDGGAQGGSYALMLLYALPNAFNEGMVLVPAYLFESAPDNRSLPILQLGHLRHCRVDNYNPGDIVEFGPDRWKVYPIGKKNTDNRSPGDTTVSGGALDHTGTFGFAVRYHGS